ncbi:hypothetical protein Ancab_007961 [Ancistrocladus abbreviatus]
MADQIQAILQTASHIRAARLMMSQAISLPMKEEAFIQRQQPKPRWVKPNTDGTLILQEYAGAGVLLQGEYGQWLGGFARNIGL